MEGSTSEEGHNTQLWIESHLYFMIWSLLQLTLIHNLDVNSNKRRSIIAAPAPFEENRWPRWIHHLRVLHLPASCVEPSLISIKCFDGSYKPLNHFLPLWSKARKKEPLLCWESGPLGVSCWLTQILHHVYPGGGPATCASVLQDDFDHGHLPPASSPLLRSDTSEASPGSDTSEGHNFSHITAAKPPSPGAREAICCPPTFDLSHEGWGGKNKTPR